MAFLKFLTPGSLALMGLGVLAGLALLSARRTRRFGRWFLGGVAAVHAVLATPMAATSLEARLPAASTADASPDATIVVFDGDNHEARARQALALAARSPADVWVLGRYLIVDALVTGGVDRGRIQHDYGFGTTRDQLNALRVAAARDPNVRFGVVVSRIHAPRVARLVAEAGLAHRVALVASGLSREPARSGARRFLPSLAALDASRDAFYELVALRYYRWQGWIR